MRSHELSRLSERDSQSVFSKKRKRTKNQSNENHKNRKECHECCTIFKIQKPFALLDTEPTFTAFQGEGCMHLHPKIHVHTRL